jgi:hypothetical protein
MSNHSSLTNAGNAAAIAYDVVYSLYQMEYIMITNLQS